MQMHTMVFILLQQFIQTIFYSLHLFSAFVHVSVCGNVFSSCFLVRSICFVVVSLDVLAVQFVLIFTTVSGNYISQVISVNSVLVRRCVWYSRCPLNLLRKWGSQESDREREGESEQQQAATRNTMAFRETLEVYQQYVKLFAVSVMELER